MKIGLFKFKITAREPLIVPAVNKGNMLRGAFGNAFRWLCCIPQCRSASSCPVMTTCPYKLVFEPSPPPGADRLSKNQDIPRPFVFRPPESAQARFETGESLDFGLVLIGRAFEFVPYFVLSFRELGEQGIGLNRARCMLEHVEEIELPLANASLLEDETELPSVDDRIRDNKPQVVYSGHDQLFRSAAGLDSSQWLETRTHQLTPDRRPLTTVSIRFLTPTFIRAEGQIITRPEFHHIFKRLRDRINALHAFYGEGPLDADFRGLGERSEKIRTLSSRFEWVERTRTSGKTRQRHELSGFVGEATYEGELDEFLPWLALGELVHVGRHTAWGNGRFELSM